MVRRELKNVFIIDFHLNAYEPKFSLFFSRTGSMFLLCKSSEIIGINCIITKTCYFTYFLQTFCKKTIYTNCL